MALKTARRFGRFQSSSVVIVLILSIVSRPACSADTPLEGHQKTGRQGEVRYTPGRSRYPEREVQQPAQRSFAIEGRAGKAAA